ncbi:unnamed protein product [Amoebophrya sp. A120]|nr:unnamed protein product [Amoebophrya sp. A120]|eukprot:GSA120T00005719001.1
MLALRCIVFLLTSNYIQASDRDTGGKTKGSKAVTKTVSPRGGRKIVKKASRSPLRRAIAANRAGSRFADCVEACGATLQSDYLGSNAPTFLHTLRQTSHHVKTVVDTELGFESCFWEALRMHVRFYQTKKVKEQARSFTNQPPAAAPGHAGESPDFKITHAGWVDLPGMMRDDFGDFNIPAFADDADDTQLLEETTEPARKQQEQRLQAIFHRYLEGTRCVGPAELHVLEPTTREEERRRLEARVDHKLRSVASPNDTDAFVGVLARRLLAQKFGSVTAARQLLLHAQTGQITAPPAKEPAASSGGVGPTRGSGYLHLFALREAANALIHLEDEESRTPESPVGEARRTLEAFWFPVETRKDQNAPSSFWDLCQSGTKYRNYLMDAATKLDPAFPIHGRLAKYDYCHQLVLRELGRIGARNAKLLPQVRRTLLTIGNIQNYTSNKHDDDSENPQIDTTTLVDCYVQLSGINFSLALQWRVTVFALGQLAQSGAEDAFQALSDILVRSEGDENLLQVFVSPGSVALSEIGKVALFAERYPHLRLEAISFLSDQGSIIWQEEPDVELPAQVAPNVADQQPDANHLFYTGSPDLDADYDPAFRFAQPPLRATRLEIGEKWLAIAHHARLREGAEATALLAELARHGWNIMTGEILQFNWVNHPFLDPVVSLVDLAENVLCRAGPGSSPKGTGTPRMNKLRFLGEKAFDVISFLEKGVLRAVTNRVDSRSWPDTDSHEVMFQKTLEKLPDLAGPNCLERADPVLEILSGSIQQQQAHIAPTVARYFDLDNHRLNAIETLAPHVKSEESRMGLMKFLLTGVAMMRPVDGTSWVRAKRLLLELVFSAEADGVERISAAGAAEGHNVRPHRSFADRFRADLVAHPKITTPSLRIYVEELDNFIRALESGDFAPLMEDVSSAELFAWDVIRQDRNRLISWARETRQTLRSRYEERVRMTSRQLGNGIAAEVVS